LYVSFVLVILENYFIKIINLFALNHMAVQESGLIELEYTDSTNNYAMQLINDDKAQAGMTIVTRSQGNGRGQRGRVWIDEPGQSLLMSVIVAPKQAIWEQFVFSASVVVAIANVLQNFLTECDIRIKWPNDIIINDKKAGGILIENILRGSQWTQSIIGLGLNVYQQEFPDTLPHATSLKIASGRDMDMNKLRDRIREHIMSAVLYPVSSARVMQAYNELLYKKDLSQKFSDFNTTWFATILHTRTDGSLEIRREDGQVTFYHHGQIKWMWE
jgi:BirA family transcriptional regulator, biotin operon repressor / biotin---[acetyl-CoA-carboxylase] ligase